MSEISDQYGAEPFERQQFGTAGVERVKQASMGFEARSAGLEMPIHAYFFRTAIKLVLVCNRRSFEGMCVQDYKSLCAAVTICATSVNIHPDRQHFTSYTNSSACEANNNKTSRFVWRRVIMPEFNKINVIKELLHVKYNFASVSVLDSADIVFCIQSLCTK